MTAATEKLGVRVSTPGQNINLAGESFGDLLAFEHMRVENLRRCVAALNQVQYGSPGCNANRPTRTRSERRADAGKGCGNELIAEVVVQLQAMQVASDGVINELLRVSREQGLRFEPMPSPGDVH